MPELNRFPQILSSLTFNNVSESFECVVVWGGNSLAKSDFDDTCLTQCDVNGSLPAGGCVWPAELIPVSLPASPSS